MTTISMYMITVFICAINRDLLSCEHAAAITQVQAGRRNRMTKQQGAHSSDTHATHRSGTSSKSKCMHIKFVLFIIN